MFYSREPNPGSASLIFLFSQSHPTMMKFTVPSSGISLEQSTLQVYQYIILVHHYSRNNLSFTKPNLAQDNLLLIFGKYVQKLLESKSFTGVSGSYRESHTTYHLEHNTFTASVVSCSHIHDSCNSQVQHHILHILRNLLISNNKNYSHTSVE